jgi:hypothetical protein
LEKIIDKKFSLTLNFAIAILAPIGLPSSLWLYEYLHCSEVFSVFQKGDIVCYANGLWFKSWIFFFLDFRYRTISINTRKSLKIFSRCSLLIETGFCSPLIKFSGQSGEQNIEIDHRYLTVSIDKLAAPCWLCSCIGGFWAEWLSFASSANAASLKTSHSFLSLSTPFLPLLVISLPKMIPANRCLWPVLADPVQFDRIRIRPLKKPDPDPTWGYKIPLTQEIVKKAAVLSSYDKNSWSIFFMVCWKAKVLKMLMWKNHLFWLIISTVLHLWERHVHRFLFLSLYSCSPTVKKCLIVFLPVHLQWLSCPYCYRQMFNNANRLENIYKYSFYC